MKITQAPKFQPITITLESSMEAEALARLVDEQISAWHRSNQVSDPEAHALCVQLSNWFTTQAQLGGTRV